MNKRTLKALKGSIKKWKGVVKGTVKDLGADNCPLCKLFFLPETIRLEDECLKCPVYEKTGRQCCLDTPYIKYYYHSTKENAQAEVRFLKSLLPKVKK